MMQLYDDMVFDPSLKFSPLSSMDENPESFDFSSSSNIIFEDIFTDISSSFLINSTSFSPVLFPMEQYNFPNLDEFFAGINNFPNLDEIWLESEEINPGSGISSPVSTVSSVDTTLVLPDGETQIGDHLATFHLLKAYGEAMEMKQQVLLEQLLRRLREKASPRGTTIERVAYYFIKAVENDQVDSYLLQESCKSYDAAFSVFYQKFPFGRFAHFAANMAILESMPEEDGRVLHIVDFELSKGIQWPPLLEALARRGQRVVRLTSIRWDDDDDEKESWYFEETKRLLCQNAESFGVKLKVEEMNMEELVCEMKKLKKRGSQSGKEWLAFNCMVGLPHMRKASSFKHVMEFLSIAKEYINGGVITMGETISTIDPFSGFGSFFEGQILHFLALFESMESQFPCHLGEARMAMESLFIAPYISSLCGSQNWDEIEKRKTLSEIGLEGWNMSKENLMEAQELVKEREDLYHVRITDNRNELVLDYMGTPLVRVSSWR
ncbi:hypothetical protein UlMin_013121 [Ulmus minor]